MELGYIIIYVADVVQTVTFYQNAFGLELQFLHESNQYAQMDTGCTTLAFASEDLTIGNKLTFRPNRAKETPAGFEIALVTEDIQAAFKKALDNGAQTVSEPMQKPWGQMVAYVTDNNGILVELCTPITSE